jgi:hypothetical protein
VRIEHAEERIRQFGKIVIEPMMHTRREERDALKQSLDMRVIDRAGGQSEPARDFGMGFGELSGKLTDRDQLAVIVRQQDIRHCCSP